MAIYRYKCPSCSAEFDVIKSVSELDSLEKCQSCGRGSIEGKHRLICPVTFYGEKPDEAFYSIPLGKIVSGKKQMRQIAKEKGWEEVGTTNITKHIDTLDAEREARAKNKYKEFFAPIEING